MVVVVRVVMDLMGVKVLLVLLVLRRHHHSKIVVIIAQKFYERNISSA